MTHDILEFHSFFFFNKKFVSGAKYTYTVCFGSQLVFIYLKCIYIYI